MKKSGVSTVETQTRIFYNGRTVKSAKCTYRTIKGVGILLEWWTHKTKHFAYKHHRPSISCFRYSVSLICQTGSWWVTHIPFIIHNLNLTRVAQLDHSSNGNPKLSAGFEVQPHIVPLEETPMLEKQPHLTFNEQTMEVNGCVWKMELHNLHHLQNWRLI